MPYIYLRQGCLASLPPAVFVFVKCAHFPRTKDLIHGANTGKPVAERASVSAVLLTGEGDEATEVYFTRT
jgi:hypothetical protein